MSKKNRHIFLVFAFFVLLTIVFFRQYVFSGRVPLPFNLLASFYSPWKFEAWSGYGAGVPNKPLGYDNLKLFYPYRKFTTDELKKGRLPLWNPYVFSGNVHAASYQAAVFYPLSVVYLFFSQMDAWSLMVMVQPVLVGWFTYLFLTSLGISRRSSLFGAIGYAFSGWMISVWEEVLVLIHSVLWLPLALCGANVLWRNKRRILGATLMSVALAMSVLAGFLQMTIYVFLITLAWNIYAYVSARKPGKNMPPEVWYCVFSFVLAAMVSSVQWIPALESYVQSPRGMVNGAFLFEQFLTPIHFLVTALVPDFWGDPGAYNYFSPVRYIQERTLYVGIFVLVLALYEFFQKGKPDRKFWKAFSVVLLLLGLALPTGWIWYALGVPILGVANPARIFSLLPFGLSVLAAYGLDRFSFKHQGQHLKYIFLFLATVLGVLWVFAGVMSVANRYYPMIMQGCPVGMGIIQNACAWFLSVTDAKMVADYANVSLRNLVLPTVFVVISWFVLHVLRSKRRLSLFFVYVMTIAGSAYFAQKILYFSDRSFEYPVTSPIKKLQQMAGLNRVWSYGEAHMLRNIPSYFYLYSPEEYDALFSYQYGELMHSIQTAGQMKGEIYRTDAILGEMGQNEPMRKNPHRLHAMAILGVKYILEKKIQDPEELPDTVRFGEDLFSVAWEDAAWRIWEYKKALPRAFVATDARYAKDKQAVADVLYNPEVNPAATITVDSPELALAPESGLPPATATAATITSYEPNRVTIQAIPDRKGYVFLSDTFFPGWEAYVDGKRANIIRANYAFRAVAIEQGKHVVEFLYRPVSFTIGMVVTGIGAGLLVLTVIASVIGQKKR